MAFLLLAYLTVAGHPAFCLPTRSPLANRNASMVELWRSESRSYTVTITGCPTISQIAEALAGGADVNARDSNGVTALMVAADQGSLDCLKFLLSKGADTSARDDTLGWTALDFAIRRGVGAIALMTAGMSNGANANSRLLGLWTNKHGDYDREHASQVTVERIKDAMLKGADVNASDAKGRTALIGAIFADNLDCFRFLISEGADANAKGVQRVSPLAWASAWGRFDCCEILVANGASLDARDNFGKTALLWAAQNDNFDCVRFLVSEGADVNSTDNGGETALMYAAETGDEQCVRHLLSSGANVNAEDNAGWTPLVDAFDHPDIAAILKQAGANYPVPKCRLAP